MSRPIDLTSLLLHSSVGSVETWWTNDIDGYVLEAQPGRSQGRPMKSRARSPSRIKRPVRPAFSRKPLSGQPTVGLRSDVSFQGAFSCPERDRATRRERVWSHAGAE